MAHAEFSRSFREELSQEQYEKILGSASAPPSVEFGSLLPGFDLMIEAELTSTESDDGNVMMVEFDLGLPASGLLTLFSMPGHDDAR